jgi:hypothetical protein
MLDKLASTCSRRRAAFPEPRYANGCSCPGLDLGLCILARDALAKLLRGLVGATPRVTARAHRCYEVRRLAWGRQLIGFLRTREPERDNEADAHDDNRDHPQDQHAIRHVAQEDAKR